MKLIILNFAFLIMASPIFAQHYEIVSGTNVVPSTTRSVASVINDADTITIFINDKKAAQNIIRTNEAATDLITKKLTANKIKSVVVQITGSSIANPRYAKSLQVGDSNAITFAELKDKPGYFNITNADVKKLLTKGKKIALHLTLNPTNPMMLMPSRLIDLGNLMMK